MDVLAPKLGCENLTEVANLEDWRILGSFKDLGLVVVFTALVCLEVVRKRRLGRLGRVRFQKDHIINGLRPLGFTQAITVRRIITVY